MAKKVDVVVVGGGPGGSIAGAYLAKGGLKTVVFEGTDEVGGLKYGTYKLAEGSMDDDFPHWTLKNLDVNGGTGCWVKAAEEVGGCHKMVDRAQSCELF